MRTKASKASKGEDEGGFEGFEGEDEGGRIRRLRRVRTKASKASKVRTKASKGEDDEKFNEHFRALTGLHNASNNQMLKQSCNQLPDAITRSRLFCDHLSQCAMVVGVLPGLRNARERAMYSNTVPWPMHLGQWPHSLRNHFIR